MQTRAAITQRAPRSRRFGLLRPDASALALGARSHAAPRPRAGRDLD